MGGLLWGCGSTGSPREGEECVGEKRRRLGAFGRAGLPGVWFDRLTRNAECGRVVRRCWVPAADAGMTEETCLGGLGAIGFVVRHGPPKDSGPAHHERGWAAVESCAEDGRVGDAAPTQERCGGGDGGSRAEEAGLKPAPTQEGAGTAGDWQAGLGAKGCGSSTGLPSDSAARLTTNGWLGPGWCCAEGWIPRGTSTLLCQGE